MDYNKPDYSLGAAYMNGKFIPISEAKIPVTDWGFLHSDATYDVAHVWQGRFFRLDCHLDRFLSGVSRLRMQTGYSRNQIKDILHNCVRLSGLKDAYVEMVCTRGVPKPGSRDPRTCENRFFAFAIPFVWISKTINGKGLHAYISSVQRISDKSVDPTIKNYHWLDFVSGLYQAYDHNAETAILTDAHGNITEGPGFNVFTINNNVMSTPSKGVLNGITRNTVIDLAQQHGIKTMIGTVSVNDCYSADEIFITSTAGGVMPITMLNGSSVGDGQEGPVTRKLRELYWQAHNIPEYSEPISY